MSFPTRIFFLVCLLALAAQPALASRFAYLPKGSTSSVAVIDTQDNTVVVTDIPVGLNPIAVATHPAGHRVYVANVGSDDVSVIETAGNTVVATVPVGSAPYHLAVSPDGGEVYVSNYSDGTVSVINTATNAVVATIAGIPGASAVAFAPSGATAYVSDYNSGPLHVIDTATRTYSAYPATVNSEGLAVHPSGRFVYISSVGSDEVGVFDTATNTLSTVLTGVAGGWGVAVHPDGRHFYVARDGGTVAVFRTSDNAQVATVSLGAGVLPGGVSLTPSGGFAYVSDQANGQVFVFNTVDYAVEPTITGLGAGMTAIGTAIQRPLFGHGSIGAGQHHTCRIRSDQSVDCWGRNDYGQATAPAGQFSQVVGGSAHSCALRTDGGIQCWGNPGPLMSPPVGNFVQLSSGARHACAIDDIGAIACWGTDVSGNTAPPPFTDYQGIATGSSHGCGLHEGIGIQCWGRTEEGQAQAPSGSFVQVVTGAAFSCALRTDHLAICWGDPTGGKTSPPAVPFTRIFAQSNQACGLDFNGGITCWGPDSQGESFAPALVHAGVATGRFHTCSLQALGVAQCWGWNVYNQAPQFALDASVPGNATLGAAIDPRMITLVVSNPGIATPYAPRSPVYAVSAGDLPPGLALSPTGELSGTPTSPGSYNFTIEGEELNGFTAAEDFTMVVGASDATPPVITPTVTGLLGDNGWYRGNVVVSWTVEDNESAITSTSNCGTVVVSVETAGQLIQCQATSAGGTHSEQVTIRLDKTRPTGAPTVSNRRPLLNEPITVQANGVDSLSGVVSETCDAPVTASVSVAAQRIFCTITDAAGNVGVRPVTYQVIYGFQGFTGTVLNPGRWNAAGLGQSITLHYQLLDFHGMPVTGLTAASISSVAMACPAKTANAAPESLSSDGLVEVADGQYEFTFTSPAQAACVRMTVELGDGNHTNRVLFKFE